MLFPVPNIKKPTVPPADLRRAVCSCTSCGNQLQPQKGEMLICTWCVARMVLESVYGVEIDWRAVQQDHRARFDRGEIE